MGGTLLALQTLLVFLLIFVAPLLVFPLGGSYFELPKVIVIKIIIDILLFLRIYSESKKHFLNHKPLLKKVHPLALTLVVVTIALSVTGMAISLDEVSFFGNVFRLQGVFLLWHLLVFAIISADISFKQLHRLIYSLFPVILVIFTVLTFLFGITSGGRAVATLGEPNSLAAVAVFFGTFVLFKGKPWEKVLAILFTTAIVLLSGSRAGLLAILIETVFFSLGSLKLVGVRKALVITLILISSTLALPLVKEGGVFENRAEIWKTAWVFGTKSPLLGHGFGVVDSSHNLFLDWWVQGGVVGVVYLLMILGLSFYNLGRSRNIPVLTLLLGLLTAMLFNPVSVVVLLMFWWSVGQGFLKPEGSRR